VVQTLGGSLDETPEALIDLTAGQVVAASKNALAPDAAPPPSVARTIVVIDDERRDARLIRRLLEATGRYKVHEAYDGASGWKAIQDHQPALIVLDLMLPDITGEELLERLSQDDTTRGIPVVVTTAKDIKAEERERLLGKIISLFEKAHLDRQTLLDYVDETLSEE